MEYHVANFVVMYRMSITRWHRYRSRTYEAQWKNINIYADDCTLRSCSEWNNISLVNNYIQTDLDNIQRWVIMNKMVIDEKNTKSMLIIGKRLRKRVIQDQHQDSDCEIVSKITEIHGVEINDNLTFENHCNSLANKVPKRNGLLKNISPYLTRDHKRTYHNAIIKLALHLNANI